MLMLLIGRAVAQRLGVDPSQLQGSGFVPGPITMSLFLTFQVLQILLVLAAHLSSDDQKHGDHSQVVYWDGAVAQE